MVTLAISQNADEDNGDSNFEDVDQIGFLLFEQRKLLDDRDKLISQVRSLSGFEKFLRAPPFDTLSGAQPRTDNRHRSLKVVLFGCPHSSPQLPASLYH